MSVKLVMTGKKIKICILIMQGWEFAHLLITHSLISHKSNEQL